MRRAIMFMLQWDSFVDTILSNLRQSRTFLGFYKLRGLQRQIASQWHISRSRGLFSDQRSTTANQKALVWPLPRTSGAQKNINIVKLYLGFKYCLDLRYLDELCFFFQSSMCGVFFLFSLCCYHLACSVSQGPELFGLAWWGEGACASCLRSALLPCDPIRSWGCSGPFKLLLFHVNLCKSLTVP